jgi:hypothetical protein
LYAAKDAMMWTDLEAEIILDGLTAYDGPSDLQVLQTAIAKALFRFYQIGHAATRPDDCTD